MVKSKSTIFISVIGLAILFSGCINRDDAQGTAIQFYSDLEANNIQAALTLLDENYFPNNTEQLLIRSNSNLGNITNYSLIGYDAQTYGSTSTVVLTYNVNRTKYNSEETMTLYKDNASPKFRIISYHIDSEDFIFKE